MSYNNSHLQPVSTWKRIQLWRTPNIAWTRSACPTSLTPLPRSPTYLQIDYQLYEFFPFMRTNFWAYRNVIYRRLRSSSTLVSPSCQPTKSGSYRFRTKLKISIRISKGKPQHSPSWISTTATRMFSKKSGEYGAMKNVITSSLKAH